MSWKLLVTGSIAVLIILLIGTYYLLPLNGESLFVSAPPLNTSFPSYTDESLQFYENMRFPTSNISYRIDGCTLKKSGDMIDAFNFVEDRTDLSFYPVINGEEIFVTCSSETKQSGDFFIAGEGGPTNITATDRFNVIHQGKIELIRESKCPNPNVGVHELLHVLGFGHSSNPDSIMYEVSKCSQVVTDDIINSINVLYSTESLPDLAFNNVSANITGRFLDTKFSVINHGLSDVGTFNVSIYADNKLIDIFDIDGLEIGFGRTITLKNVRVPRSTALLMYSIDYSLPELDKKNNKIELAVQS